ncbi:MAG: chloride channel protein [Lewinellaceae bacterium]|nr:chloride channel protein [Saprospiraceae bacterium]MCB9339597.1 chloride channel protein [Lewinellaceae bacterium]
MPTQKLIRIRRTLEVAAGKAIKWLSEHISERNYQILVAIIIGIVAGLAAVVMKYSVAKVRDLMMDSNPSHSQIGFVFFPIIGIMLTVFYIRYILRRPLEIGTSWLIYAISKKRVNLPKDETYAHIVSSSLTVGLGGSVGLESPIVCTGAAIGSNLARLLRVGRRKQTLFLTCGAAAGLAAIFNCPVAAVIFAFEVLLTDIALHSFIPLLISAATGAVVSRFFYYEQIFYLPATDWSIKSIPFYGLLGMACGLLSVYMMRLTLYFKGYFAKKKRQREKFLVGGLALGVMIFLMPPLFGEGYETVNQLFTGDYSAITENSIFYQFSGNIWVVIAFAVAVVLTKAIAAAATIGMGGNGGVFAPAVFSGAVLGFIFAITVNMVGITHLHVADFIAVGMAGILSGLIKSPLTGIFLVAEITGGYTLFVPLMIVSALSYFISHYFEPYSVFTKDLYYKGLWAPSHEKDRQILHHLNLEELIERNFAVLRPENTLGQLVKVISNSKRNVFPVVDNQGNLKGILLLDDVRELMFKPEKYLTVFVKDLMYPPPTMLDVKESMESVMDKFERHQAWNLPILKDGKYMGFVSKSSVFGKYREILQRESEES